MNKITLLLSFVLVFGLSQCRKPVLPDFNSGGAQPITFTTAEEAGRGDFFQEGGNLKFNWTLGGETEPKDRLYVYASSDGTFDAGHSEYCGLLKVKKIETNSAGVSVATFEGYTYMSSEMQSKMKEGTSKMRFIHYGKNVSVTTGGDDEGVASVSFAQQYGKLKDEDCLSGEKSVSSMTMAMLDMDYKSDGKYNSGGAMKTLFAIAKFSFEKFTPATTVLLGDNVKTEINVSKNGKIEYSESGGTIVLNGVASSYYVVLVPERQYVGDESVDATKCVFRGGGWTASGSIGIKPGAFFSGSESGTAINISPKDSIPEGGLNGRFSVAPGKQVHFSKGNLQYLPWGLPAGQSFNPKFRFAENQWDYLGSGSSSAGVVLGGYSAYNSPPESAARDLFGWGTAKLEGNTSVPWALSTYDSYYGPSENLNDGSASGTNYETYDWGHLMTPLNTWRTMSNEEFWYLYDTRNNNASFNSADKYLSGHGTLTLSDGGTRNGLFILPDDYYRTTDGRPKHTQRRGDTWSYTTAQLVTYNIVFLPQGGYRDNTALDRIGFAGHYWTSTHANGTNAYVIDYNSDNGVNAQKEHSFLRHYGCCVRLVANVENNSIGTATPFGSGNW